MRQVNKSIKRERHITPIINEIINDLNGAKVFTKLDLNQGYNQLELAPESRYLTMFSTHMHGSSPVSKTKFWSQLRSKNLLKRYPRSSEWFKWSHRYK